jgi:hypothetical protein
MQVTPDANPINPRKFREEALKRFHDQLPEHLRPKEEGYSNQYVCMYVCMYVCTVLENHMYWCLKIVFVCTSKDEILCFVTTCINMIYPVFLCMYVCMYDSNGQGRNGMAGLDFESHGNSLTSAGY